MVIDCLLASFLPQAHPSEPVCGRQPRPKNSPLKEKQKNIVLKYSPTNQPTDKKLTVDKNRTIQIDAQPVVAYRERRASGDDPPVKNGHDFSRWKAVNKSFSDLFSDLRRNTVEKRPGTGSKPSPRFRDATLTDRDIHHSDFWMLHCSVFL